MFVTKLPPNMQFGNKQFTRMSSPKTNDPLHGVTLEAMLHHLVAHYGWETMGEYINIRCFQYDPSIKSSLAFLRKTPWARTKTEQLYLLSLGEK
jgi:uncharacterized protein (DUF2132 family)